MRSLCAFLCFCFFLPLHAQRKALDISDAHRWRKLEQPQLTPDGRWAVCISAPVTEGDSVVLLYETATGKERRFERATKPQFSYDGQWLVFRIKPPLDSLKAMRRRKVKDDDLPKDSLGVFYLAEGRLIKIARIRNYALPEKWSGQLIYQQEPEKPVAAKPQKDTSSIVQSVPDSLRRVSARTEVVTEKKKSRKEDKDQGYRLMVLKLANGRVDTFPFVQQYSLAKRRPYLLFATSGQQDTLSKNGRPAIKAGVYRLDLNTDQLRPLFRSKGKYKQLRLSDNGDQAVFLADTDTTKARVRAWQLCYWREHPKDTARILAKPGDAFMPSDWGLNEYSRPVFSENGSKLYFALSPPPVLNDTTLLNEEIVNVEVWAWNDKRLYTEQKKRLDADRKRAYPVVWHTKSDKFVLLGIDKSGNPDAALPEWRFQEEQNSDVALASTQEPYAQDLSWEGTARRDVYVADLGSGSKRLLVGGRRVRPFLSPSTRFVAWWSDVDTSWFLVSTAAGASSRRIIEKTGFHNEETDVPDYPDPYGLAGWVGPSDEAVLIYDRYDIWRMHTEGNRPAERLTRGRETRTTYRYVKLDPEERFIPTDANLLLHFVNDSTKSEGYIRLDLKNGRLTPWLAGPYVYSRQPIKAREASVLLFSKQNYQTFPDLLTLKLNEPESTARRLTNANPQQSEYKWGTIELIEWTSLSGKRLQGLLIKPDNFDPNRKYPMIVNFYERMSDGLHIHRSPDVPRSVINYTQYASRGYLVFVPDIPYRTGYPGESAYDAVMSGVTDLISKGFVDAAHIGVQGHSWGGYQIAYLITRTNLFTCAEAGAPVANMTSAYGGIRWETGLSRMFQYERQQSRIGGTLWQYPLRYLENSPLFSMDKVQTPVLILHNDNDGAVPWQQGIEMFSALRRLGKPAWLLNYNDEPHWPVKLQNRLDFQRRMQQFFDYYLMDAPMPRWMKRGLPPVEKGIRLGLETDED